MIRRNILFLLLLITALWAQEEKSRVAVMEIDDGTLRKQEAVSLTERLIMLLDQSGKYTILEREMMNTILQEQGFQQSGCTSGECAVEVGQMLGVEKMVSCKIGVVGRYYTISLRIIDVESGKIDKSVGHDVLGTIETVLLTGMGEAVDKLTGNSAVAEKGRKEKVEKPTVELTPEQQYEKAVRRKKGATIALASGAGVSAGVAGLFWVQKFSYHDDYLKSTIQDDMDMYIGKEKTATIVASAATAVTAALIPVTIVVAKKEIEKPGVTVSFAPIISPTVNGFMIRGEF